MSDRGLHERTASRRSRHTCRPGVSSKAVQRHVRDVVWLSGFSVVFHVRLIGGSFVATIQVGQNLPIGVVKKSLTGVSEEGWTLSALQNALVQARPRCPW